MPTDGERLATLEEQVRDFAGDMAVMATELGRARDRLHSLENSVNGFVAIQAENRKQEARQYQRFSNRVGLGQLAIAFALFVLTAATIWAHHG